MKKTIAALAFISCILLFSCQKSLDSKPKSAATVSSDATVPVNVFVAGKMPGTDGKSAATFWKNGQPVALSQEVNQGNFATSLFVYGTDVYVGGYSYGTGATYWKNGTPYPIAFSDAENVANGIYVNATSVYAAGYTDYHEGLVYAWHWKNGVETRLNDPDTSLAKARGITVSGTDIYAVGYEQPYSNNRIYPRLWKNGLKASLSNPSTQGQASAVSVSGGNVYVAGWQMVGTKHAATYWKNGVPVTVSKNFSKGAEANAIFISGTDIYVAGKDNYGTHNVATYWKNGIQVTVTDGSTDAEARSIVVDADKNVWVAGTVTAPTANVVAVYWKNGSRVNLSKWLEHADASAILLAK